MTGTQERTVLGQLGVRGSCFHLITPDNQYPSALADWPGANVVKLVTPRNCTARFGQYLIRLPPGGGTAGAIGEGFEHFLYLLAGEAAIAAGAGEARGGLSAGVVPGGLEAGDYAYLPEGQRFALSSSGGAELLWVKRRYDPLASDGQPPALAGSRTDIPTTPLSTPGVSRQELLPADDPRRDFTMSILQFAAGAGLPNIEIHDEEHGLYMLSGRGSYHLDGVEYPVLASDFIYMAPYCPQGFVATGEEPAEYLLYKDVFRDGFWSDHS